MKAYARPSFVIVLLACTALTTTVAVLGAETTTPRERVEGFIEDYFAAWQAEQVVTGDVDLRRESTHSDTSAEPALYELWLESTQSEGSAGPTRYARWQARIEELERRHFVAGGTSGESNILASQARHEPGRETIVGESSSGEGVVVIETHTAMTEIPANGSVIRVPELGGNYWEYELTQVGGDWRITRIMNFYDESKAALVDDPAKFSGSSLTAPFEPLEPDVEVKGDRLFEAGRVNLWTATIDP